MNLEVVKELENEDICFEIVGDANEPGTFMSATRQASDSILNDIL